MADLQEKLQATVGKFAPPSPRPAADDADVDKLLCAITKAIKTMDAIGRDWKADGQMQKFYATNYLVEAIRHLLRRTTQEGEK